MIQIGCLVGQCWFCHLSFEQFMDELGFDEVDIAFGEVTKWGVVCVKKYGVSFMSMGSWCGMIESKNSSSES
jgi:hypothetical protein